MVAWKYDPYLVFYDDHLGAIMASGIKSRGQESERESAKEQKTAHD